ncbi:hypothetical protein CPB86DRAFT_795758 [Serendipita vermifera]|nr:hypothetical protein CPB86DRAFT_795758 [Serendipita vermifera]
MAQFASVILENETGFRFTPLVGLTKDDKMSGLPIHLKPFDTLEPGDEKELQFVADDLEVVSSKLKSAQGVLEERSSASWLIEGTAVYQRLTLSCHLVIDPKDQKKNWTVHASVHDQFEEKRWNSYLQIAQLSDGGNLNPFILMLRDDLVKIQSISVRSPLVATRNTFEGIDPRYTRRDLEIWNSKTPNEYYPAVVSHSNPISRAIQVKLSTEYGLFFHQEPFVFKAVRPDGFGEITFQFNPVEDSDSGVFEAILTVPIQRVGPAGEMALPWGIKGSTTWSINRQKSPFYWQIRYYPTIELYAISPYVPEGLQSTGIPLEILRLMVLPVSKLQILKIEKWIEWVTAAIAIENTMTSLEKRLPSLHTVLMSATKPIALVIYGGMIRLLYYAAQQPPQMP